MCVCLCVFCLFFFNKWCTAELIRPWSICSCSQTLLASPSSQKLNTQCPGSILDHWATLLLTKAEVNIGFKSLIVDSRDRDKILTSTWETNCLEPLMVHVQPGWQWVALLPAGKSIWSFSIHIYIHRALTFSEWVPDFSMLFPIQSNAAVSGKSVSPKTLSTALPSWWSCFPVAQEQYLC